jgi:CBS domain-containing protein
MRETTVRACMHEGVIACSPDTPLEEVAETMATRRISALVVMEGDRAVGVISKTDLVNVAFVQPYLRHWRGMSARHLMSAPVISIEPEASLGEAVRVLEARRIHRLVVTERTADGERPIGILSLTDVARALAAAAPGQETAS